jgi:tripartite-type tricarboxylate transporter receptor subunit TctC
MLNKSRVTILAALAALFAVGSASAQTFPDKPLKLVLPYNPGGIIDFAGRQIAQRLGEVLGQAVVAENRPGAGGMTGTSAVARSAADGYTLLLMDPAIVINPSLQKDVPYKLSELRPVSVVTSSPLVMVISPKIEADTVAEFGAFAAKNKGKLNYASAGIGTTPHLAGELYNLKTGIEAAHVPYRGSGPSVPDLMAGKVHYAMNTYVVVAPFIADKRLKVLGVAGPKRIAAAPDVPTMAEAGMPGVETNLWTAIFVPAGTPDAVVAKLNAALKQVVANNEVKAAFEKMGVAMEGLGTAESATFVKAEYEKWADLIKRANIKPE